MLQPDKGEIIFEGKRLEIRNPAQAISMGIAMVPENRKEQGIIPQMGVGYNISLAVLDAFIKLIKVNTKREKGIIGQYMDALRVKASSPAVYRKPERRQPAEGHYCQVAGHKS